MTWDDQVPTDAVMAELQRHGVGVTEEDGTYTLSKGDVVEVQVLGDYCGRRMLQRFARKFDVAIHLLFHAHDGGVLASFPKKVKKPR